VDDLDFIEEHIGAGAVFLFYSLCKEKLHAKKKEAVHRGLSTRTYLSITMSGVSRQKIRRDWMDLEVVAARRYT
jgi:hypothetical protein